MKRNNKGFTLAELLIVIAIIAILIAIAIPAFSASLYSARIQTDHANIRSTYAMYKNAEMLGLLEVDGTPEGIDINATGSVGEYFFQKDGSLLKGGGTNDYVLQTDTKSADDCAASVGCGADATAKVANHKKGGKISIEVESGGKISLKVNNVVTVTNTTPTPAGP